jgi:hypothetical protein
MRFEEMIAGARHFARTVMVLFTLALFGVVYAADVRSQAGTAPANHLARGIEFFRVGRFDEALVELKAVVEVRPHTPLAYYYAALIRYGKGQYPQSRKNLLAALEDSADFYDAAGMLACTDLKMGNVTDAFIEWRRFTAAVGVLNPGEPVTERSIQFPAEYREKLARANIAAGIDSAASRSLTASSRAVGRTDTARTPEAALRDLNQRIESRIRRGYYAVGGTGLLLIVGIVVTMLWMRRRRKLRPELTFESEVDRMVGVSPELNELDYKGDESVTIPATERTLHGPDYRRAPQLVQSTSWGPRSSAGEKVAPEQPTFPVPPSEDTRRPITEEVKALVTRMYREGHSIVDIARMADLTRTEVELIVAVRTHRTERLIEAVTGEEDAPAPDALSEAVRELAVEGRGVQEIARRLGISTSEVKLAIAVMNRRKER